MATLRSTYDWSGREIAGVVLGEATREFPGDENTLPSGDYIWDHPGIPGDFIDDDGDVFVEVDDNA